MGHHLLWLTALALILEMFTLPTYIEVTLHTPHAPATKENHLAQNFEILFNVQKVGSKSPLIPTWVTTYCD